MAFWVTYDHLGKVLIASVIWSLLVGPWALLFLTAVLAADPSMILAVGLPAWVLGFGVAAPIAMAGLAHMVKEFIEKKDGSIRTMFQGMRLYWKPAVLLGLIYVVAFVCLLTNIWFYGYSGVLEERAPWLGFLMSMVAVWALIFLGLTALFVIPALVQKRDGCLATLKLAALLVLDNPILAFGLAVQVFAVTVISILAPPVLVFLHGGLVAVMTGCAYEMLARKYAAIEQRRQETESGESRHTATVSGQGELVDPDADDDYMNRGFRDFLFPWKG